MSKIHSTAIIDPSCEIDPSVEIGAYSVIGKNVTIDKTLLSDHMLSFPVIAILEKIIKSISFLL